MSGFKERVDTKWNRKSVLKLITIYKQYPLLYDPSHLDYYNRFKRIEALNIIRDKLSTVYKGVTIHEIRRKIGTLRSQYNSEKAAIRKAKEANLEYTTNLWSFSKLRFFEKYKASKAPIVKGKMQLEKKTDKKNIIVEARSVLRFAELLKNNVEPDMSKEDIFAQFIGTQLKQIVNVNIYNDATWAVQIAIRKALQKDERLELDQLKNPSLKE